MQNKQFTITKTGYTAGVYGCTNEYFTLITSNKDGMESYIFSGMYGVESRVRDILKENGYEEYYSYSNYGRLTRKDVRPNTPGEHSFINELKERLNNAK